MSASSPVMHALEVEAAADPVQQPPHVLMKDLPGMPGTPCGLTLRALQLIFAVTSLAVMSSTADFDEVSAFRYLIAVNVLQCVWSLTAGIVDIYSLHVNRDLRSVPAVSLFAIGDGVTCVLSFTGSCAAAAITVLIKIDMHECYENHCASFQTAVAMGFMCSFCVLPSFLVNLHAIASFQQEDAV